MYFRKGTKEIRRKNLEEENDIDQPVVTVPATRPGRIHLHRVPEMHILWDELRAEKC